MLKKQRFVILTAAISMILITGYAKSSSIETEALTDLSAGTETAEIYFRISADIAGYITSFSSAK